MKTVYFVRHGQVESNVKKLHQGPDDPLTELGRKQSEFIARRVANLPVDALIASPYVRTKETAKIIAQTIGVEPEYSELFVENRVPSRFVGVPEDSPEAQEAFAIIRSNYGPGFRFEDEESYDEHALRATAALSLLSERPEEHILVVTHGTFLKTLLAHVVFDMSPSPKEIRRVITHLQTTNTGITICTHGADRMVPWMLEVFNDHAHLG